MIAFTHADPRFPFLRETGSEAAGRWGVEGGGSACFFDTPNGAWAEFLRHEEIRDPEDLATIRRSLWVVNLGERPAVRPRLDQASLVGGADTWAACRAEGKRLRMLGVWGLAVPSAALLPGGARGRRLESTPVLGPERNGRVLVLFRHRRSEVGWIAAAAARPGREILGLTRHF